MVLSRLLTLETPAWRVDVEANGRDLAVDVRERRELCVPVVWNLDVGLAVADRLVGFFSRPSERGELVDDRAGSVVRGFVVDDSVIRLGFAPRPDVLCSSPDVFASPSEAEGALW